MLIKYSISIELRNLLSSYHHSIRKLLIFCLIISQTVTTLKDLINDHLIECKSTKIPKSHKPCEGISTVETTKTKLY